MTEEQYGKNGDKTPNDRFCTYCFQDGKFAQDCSMEEMVEFCAPFEVEGGRAGTLEEAKAGLRAYFVTLERWR